MVIITTSINPNNQKEIYEYIFSFDLMKFMICEKNLRIFFKSVTRIRFID